MKFEKTVVSTHDFMGGLVTVYYVEYAGGGESYEYGVDLWKESLSPLLIPMTQDGYGSAVDAEIDGYISIIEHIF